MPTKAKYYIYFNRHKDVWSIKHKGLVIKHAVACYFQKANTVIQTETQHRAQQTGIRNVHAFIASTQKPTYMRLDNPEDYHRVYYTPFAANYFSVYEDEQYKEAKRLENVYFMKDGKVYCKNYK